MKKRSLIIVLASLGIMLFSSTASANFSLAPGLVNKTMRFQVDAGDQQTGYVILRNTGDEEMQVNLYANDGAKTNDGHFAVKLPTEEQTGLGIWTTFGQSVYTLDPKEDREVPFQISMPSGLPPGVYSGGLALEPYSEKEALSSGGTSVEIKTRVVIPFFVEVPGEKISELTFGSFEHQQTTNNKVFFTMQFENNGNTALILKPKIHVKSLGGLFSEVITDDDIELYMGESTEFRVNWENKPFIGFFDAEAVVAYYENDIIKNEVAYIGDKRATVSVTVIPWTALLIFLAVIVLLIILVIYHQGRIKKMKKNSASYTVKAGDTLNDIAKKNGVDWKLVAKLNNLKPPYELSENQTILIPPKK